MQCSDGLTWKPALLGKVDILGYLSQGLPFLGRKKNRVNNKSSRTLTLLTLDIFRFFIYCFCFLNMRMFAFDSIHARPLSHFPSIAAMLRDLVLWSRW